MVLRRGFSLQAGERVLVVEDVVTTGGSVKKVLALLENFAVRVVGVASLVDRSVKSLDFGAPFSVLLKLKTSAWLPEQCPQCRAGVKLTRPKF